MAEIRLYDPRDLSREEWLELQGIALEAYVDTLDRTKDEIEALVDFNDPDRFYGSHVDPNTEVGRRYNDNQSYTHPRVAVASEYHELAGFAYTAHNVSGPTETERTRKRLTVVKNYLWLREVVVAPWIQSQGIGGQLGRRLLRNAIPIQPVSTYIWPDEMPSVEFKLEGLGFQATGEQQVRIYGEDSEPVRQVRMQAPTAFGVRRFLH